MLIVDASADPPAELTRPQIEGTEVERITCERSLPVQRRVGIEVLRGRADYVAMLDDDMVLSESFVERTLAFLESPKGGSSGGFGVR